MPQRYEINTTTGSGQYVELTAEELTAIADRQAAAATKATARANIKARKDAAAAIIEGYGADSIAVQGLPDLAATVAEIVKVLNLDSYDGS